MIKSVPVRALLVDFGGVIYSTPQPYWVPILARLMRIDHKGIIDMLQASPRESKITRDIMTGAIREEDVWAEAARRWRMSPERLAKLRSRSQNRKHLNTELLAFVRSLRPGLITAILTNAGTQFRETFLSAYALHEFVDHIIISAEVGLAKPEPEIYHLAAERLGVEPRQAVFVDDRAENIAGAEEAGMRAILYKGNTKKLIEEIRRMI
jgi:putative hydrolase of the HAD superfamily